MRSVLFILGIICFSNFASAISKRDSLIIGGEKVYLERDTVASGDSEIWMNYQTDYRPIPQTIKWGIQLTAGGMIQKDIWSSYESAQSIAQLNVDHQHWRWSPSFGFSGYAMWNETIGLGLGWNSKSLTRQTERALPLSTGDLGAYGFRYQPGGLVQIDLIDVDSTGFFELDTTLLQIQAGSFKAKSIELPLYWVFAYEAPRSLWSYQGFLGAVYSKTTTNSGKSTLISLDEKKLIQCAWESATYSQWSMYGRIAAQRSLKADTKIFAAIAGHWPRNSISSPMGPVVSLPFDLTFGISWEY